MKKVFKDVMEIDHVYGALLLSFSGDIVYKEFSPSFSSKVNVEKREWQYLLDLISDVNEADLVFEGANVYLRRFASGYLIILMGVLAPVAMVRLSCNLLLPSLEKKSVKNRGVMRFLNSKS